MTYNVFGGTLNIAQLNSTAVVVLCVGHRRQYNTRVVVQRCCIAAASWSYWLEHTLCPRTYCTCTTSEMHSIEPAVCHALQTRHRLFSWHYIIVNG